MTTEERDRRMAMLRAAQPYTSGRQRYYRQMHCYQRRAAAWQAIWKHAKRQLSPRKC